MARPSEEHFVPDGLVVCFSCQYMCAAQMPERQRTCYDLQC